MSRRANFKIEKILPDRVLLRDVGPHSQHPTITNDADAVVADMIQGGHGVKLEARRLFYFDSNGDIDELVIRDGRFASFSFGGWAD